MCSTHDKNPLHIPTIMNRQILQCGFTSTFVIADLRYTVKS